MSARRHTDLLIIGAGPFGLGLARHASKLGIDHAIVGRPMEFWRNNMPRGMLLRSGVRWHLDPANELTFRQYMHETSVDRADLRPLGLEPYLGYAKWFQDRAGIAPINSLVSSLTQADDGFEALLDDGSIVRAGQVALAIGFHPFAHVPGELGDMLPAGRWSHTRDFVSMEHVAGRRYAIVGGRQSAFEWAALLADEGADAIHVIHRHPTPNFERSDWSWVEELLGASEYEPGWWQSLPDAERERIGGAFWSEGRLKLEPWLAPRLDPARVHLWPECTITDARAGEDALALELSCPAAEVEVDHVILATGFRPDLARVDFLAPALREQIRTDGGFPVLDAHFQTTVPRLYATSMLATQAFGPFMAFTVSVRAGSRILGDAIAKA